MKEEHTISWSVQPHKKSINFGIFKHPGSGIAATPRLKSSTFEPPSTPALQPIDAAHDSSRSASSAAAEKLKAIGLRLVSWCGACEANQVSSGKYAVPKDEGGMYALVFDNTFAKQLSKTATFVLLTYPSNNEPQISHHAHHLQGSLNGSTTGLRSKPRPRLFPDHRRSSESLGQAGSLSTDAPTTPLALSDRQENSESSIRSSFYTGILQKRRRKRHQGYARRFFSLDYTTSTLSYYHNRNTLALRGSVPLSLAAIGANATTREISIDSGAEVWHLKALNQKEFEAWKKALELACRVIDNQTSPAGLQLDPIRRHQSGFRANVEEEKEWAKIEGLVSRVAGSRDAVRRLAKDSDPKYLPSSTSSVHEEVIPSGTTLHSISSTEESPPDQVNSNEYFNPAERWPFWKRKPSAGRTNPAVFKRSVSAQPTIPPRSSSTLPSGITPFKASSNYTSSSTDESLHDNCMALLKDLDAVVHEFAALIAGNKQRRLPISSSAISRLSTDSQGSQEFFDAEGGDASQLLMIQQESDDENEGASHDSAEDEVDFASASEVDDSERPDGSPIDGTTTTSLFPSKAKSLSPLPSLPLKRRELVPSPTIQPPSLIGFLRKNVGKDFTTISMPVSANEPISLLQRASEQIEYSDMLDKAASHTITSVERLLYVCAFAISPLSANRVKERAVRKPFNPMLGETYELVREDRGFRFIAEKVSHRPVQMACQAEAEHWTFTQSPKPTQKFWGKSAELITEGRVRVILHTTGDRYSWTAATCFLRNIIAGEKYVEPVGTMNIMNETSREHAIVTFKSKGMFSGRSEDVVVQTYDSHGEESPLGLIGKWTSSLNVTERGSVRSPPLWTVGELVPDASKRYGLTSFAASLNEITRLENDKLPPTDTRLRPDQLAVERGDLEQAEVLKAKLEESQRERRKVMEEDGVNWKPAWFSMVEGVDGEEVWKLKGGKESYWELRAKNEWKGLQNVLAV